ncbi:hypothetical protein ACFWN7_13140 [Agromyces sp. NPDC058484]|uniref:hypothetical protein n=1 Tax=Agromyces sp. NPDC058484 TaxID=3346524 RepID=UPI0036667C6E
MSEDDDVYLRANAEANEAFGALFKIVNGKVDEGESQLSILDVARSAGLEIDERVLAELKLPDFVPVHPFLRPEVYFPWRPLWCWWWHYRYPYYRCCHWWWNRCHWWAD